MPWHQQLPCVAEFEECSVVLIPTLKQASFFSSLLKTLLWHIVQIVVLMFLDQRVQYVFIYSLCPPIFNIFLLGQRQPHFVAGKKV
jgi:hypothetical protein